MTKTLDGHTESIRGELGQGMYSLGDLRLYVAYEGERDDADRVLRWLTRTLNPVAHESRTPDYSFSDLISLFVVRELHRRGVKDWRIRDAEEYLRRLWKTDRPFVSDKIATDGCDVFAGRERISGQLEAASRQGQQTMLDAVRDNLTTVKYRHGEAVTWSPVKGVVLDPNVQFGEPVVAGTRVLTAAVADAIGAVGQAQVAEMFDLEPASVRAALKFERQLAKLRA